MFRKAAAIVLILLIAMTASGCFADHFTVSHITYDTTYEKILKMYLQVINGYGTKNYGRHDLFNDAVYSWNDPSDSYKSVISATKRRIGYMIMDVNRDGIDELLIGSGGGYLNSVFTMDDGKVRELIRAGGYGTASSEYSCAMMVDGAFFRHGHGGADLDYYEIWQMNGTGAVSFVEGYHTDGGWYRSNAPMSKVTSSAGAKVKSSVAEKWLRTQEENIFTKKFVPFSVLESFPDDPWNIAVLSVKGSTTSSAKVNVRRETSDKSKLVATKNVGTYVRVLSREDGYFKIAFGKKEGYVRQEYLTPLTYRIPADDNPGTDEVYEALKAQEERELARREAEEQSRTEITIKRIEPSPDNPGTDRSETGYRVTEEYVRSDFYDPEEPDTEEDSLPEEELYGLVIKKLATRSGPSPRAEDTGTYSLKGKRIRVYSRAYDPIENAWWVKCDVPYRGKIRTLWAWYTRFDSKTLPLESIPIDEDY